MLRNISINVVTQAYYFQVTKHVLIEKTELL